MVLVAVERGGTFCTPNTSVMKMNDLFIKWALLPPISTHPAITRGLSKRIHYLLGSSRFHIMMRCAVTLISLSDDL